jgi:Flp pilus assembly protein TadB
MDMPENKPVQPDAGQPEATGQKKRFNFSKEPERVHRDAVAASNSYQEGRKSDAIDNLANSLASKHKNIETAMIELGMRETTASFIRRMIFVSIATAAVLSVVIIYLLYSYNVNIVLILLAVVALPPMLFITLLNNFILYPVRKTRNEGKAIEREILFASRDLVVSMRSGLPLYNAMVTVSSGYGAASREFGKVISLVQLGESMEQAIDEVSKKSQSKTFQKLMLQASVSIKAGADVISALQGVADDITSERVIELRRYGQSLNALSMFYMLFGIILPSMGIAVLSILTTFISIFTITPSTLTFVVFFIFGIQLIFLNLMSASRPAFAM